MLRATEMAHALVSERVNPGDTVIDATVGTGGDTVFLAQCVGETGRVIGFDVQEQALLQAREKIAEMGISDAVELHGVGHESLADYVDGPIAAAMFNLGYLPGGDKSLVTLPGTTLTALDAVVHLLGPAGMVTVLCYTGHAGGAEEAEAVLKWADGLEPEQFKVVRHDFDQQGRQPPFLIAVERSGV